ncbi:MAG: hypothetical protein LQ343_000151 [Gyalolechia ehrenbergii]|nr:MAG: hypothetical protein LQ343_000151 [Gyalolechia ehrenbergii]
MQNNLEHHQGSVQSNEQVAADDLLSKDSNADHAVTGKADDAAEVANLQPVRGRDLLSLMGMTSRSLSPETYPVSPENTRRIPTEAERAAARARARELQEQLDDNWKPRKIRADIRLEMKRNEKIGKGGFIGGQSPRKKRGRPPARRSGPKKVFDDSEPEIDSLGYRPGQREEEDRRFARAAQSRPPVKGKAQVPEQNEANFVKASEEDTDPPPTTKKRRSIRTGADKSTPKKAEKAKAQKTQYTPAEPPYAPTLPPASQLGRAATNSYQPPTQEYYSPSSTPHENPYTSITLNVKHSTSQQRPAASRSFFDQRLAAIGRSNAISRAKYPPGFDDKPLANTSAYENAATNLVGEAQHSQAYYGHPHEGRYVDTPKAGINTHEDIYSDDDIGDDARPGAADEEWQ